MDRGPFSADLIKYATKTQNVFSVVGNHEASFLEAIHDPDIRNVHISPKMGGAWIEQFSEAELRDFADLIRQRMALSITVKFSSYSIGVIHAEAPDDWNSLC